jgi:hypothetical protein
VEVTVRGPTEGITAFARYASEIVRLDRSALGGPAS